MQMKHCCLHGVKLNKHETGCEVDFGGSILILCASTVRLDIKIIHFKIPLHCARYQGAIYMYIYINISTTLSNIGVKSGSFVEWHGVPEVAQCYRSEPMLVNIASFLRVRVVLQVYAHLATFFLKRQQVLIYSVKTLNCIIITKPQKRHFKDFKYLNINVYRHTLR